jgi:zinc transporter ZupT
LLFSSLLAALGLAVIHLFSSKLRFLDVIPRNRWLSIAGGVAVAYVVLHLLPELQEYHEVLSDVGSGLPLPGEQAAYVLTLLGLVVFYGLEKFVRKAKAGGEGDTTDAGTFWLHIGSYSVYNVFIGYLLVREDRDWQSLALFFIGIGLHFVVNDHGLRQQHKQKYRRIGRWMLSGAILLGWLVGVSTEIHEAITASVVAFLAGGILLNTFKEELPEERESRFWAFGLGAFGYAAILLVM